jgi:transposase InsO family protein
MIARTSRHGLRTPERVPSCRHPVAAVAAVAAVGPGRGPRLQIELFDRRNWATRAELANAIFEWIEAFYNPIRGHSSLGYLSPLEHERLHSAAHEAA